MSGKVAGFVLLGFALLLVGAILLERRLTPDLGAEFEAASKAGEDLSRFEVPLPASGMSRIYKIGRTPNTLTVETGDVSTNHYYFRLCEIDTGHPVVDFFIRAKKTETVSVPNGVYRLHQSSGQKWYGYGNSRFFGLNTEFTESKTNMVFTGDSHWKLTLNTTNGNLKSGKIDRHEF